MVWIGRKHQPINQLGEKKQAARTHTQCAATPSGQMSLFKCPSLIDWCCHRLVAPFKPGSTFFTQKETPPSDKLTLIFSRLQHELSDFGCVKSVDVVFLGLYSLMKLESRTT